MEKEDTQLMNNTKRENEDFGKVTEYSDFYTDICNFDLGTEIEKAKEENKVLLDNISELQSTNEKLIDVIGILTVQENNLKTNISSLYLTAKTEIERKDRVITELRMELEDLKFRRVGKRMYDNNLENHRPPKIMKIEDKKDICLDYNIRNVPENGSIKKEIEVNQIQQNEFIGMIERRNEQERYLGNINPNTVEENRLVTNWERVGRGRSRDRDRKSEYRRSRSTGRPHMDQNRRYNGNNRFNENFSRNRESSDTSQEHFHRREDTYYNKYGNKFKESDHQSRRDLSNKRYRNDSQSQSSKDARLPEYRDKNERDTEKRRRFSSRERRHHNHDNNNESELRSENRRADKPRVRSKSECDYRRSREKRCEVLEQIPDDEDLEINLEREKRKYTRISYADYKERKQPALTVNEKEEPRKEKSEEEPQNSIRQSDNIEVPQESRRDRIKQSEIVVSQANKQNNIRKSDNAMVSQETPQHSIRHTGNISVSQLKPQDSIKQSDNIVVPDVKSQDSTRNSDNILGSQEKPEESIKQSEIVVSQVNKENSKRQSDSVTVSQENPQDRIGHSGNIVKSHVKPQDSIKQSDDIVVPDVKTQDSTRNSDNIVVFQENPQESIKQSEIEVSQVNKRNDIRQSSVTFSQENPQDSSKDTDNVLSQEEPRDNISQTDNIGNKDDENISLNACENQSLSSKEDDAKSMNTSQLTFTSEGSEGQLSHKKKKKKLRAVTKLENKILKTPIKKYPQEKGSEVRNVEKHIKVKNIIDKRLSSLFDEVDDVIYTRDSSWAEVEQKETKQVDVNLNKPNEERNSTKVDDGKVSNKISNSLVIINDKKELIVTQIEKNKKESLNRQTLIKWREIKSKTSNTTEKSLLSMPLVDIDDKKEESKNIQTEKDRKKSSNDKTIDGEIRMTISDSAAETLIYPPLIVIDDKNEDLQHIQTEKNREKDIKKKIFYRAAEGLVSSPVVVIDDEKELKDTQSLVSVSVVVNVDEKEEREVLQKDQTEKNRKKSKNDKIVLDDGGHAETMVSPPVVVIDDEKELRVTQTEDNKKKSRSLVSTPVVVIDDKEEVKHTETKNKKKPTKENPLETKVPFENTKKDNLLEVKSTSLQSVSQTDVTNNENIQNLRHNLKNDDAKNTGNDAVQSLDISWEMNDIEPVGINIFSETTGNNEIDEKLLRNKTNDANSTPECIEKISSEVENMLEQFRIKNSQRNVENVKTVNCDGNKENRKLLPPKKSPSPVRKSSEEKDSNPNGKVRRDKNCEETIEETKSVELKNSENEVNEDRKESSNFEPLKRRIRSSSLYARYEHESAEDDDFYEENVIIPNNRRRTKSISEKSPRKSSDVPKKKNEHANKDQNLNKIDDLETRIGLIRKYKIPKKSNQQVKDQITNGLEQDVSSKTKESTDKRKSSEIKAKQSSNKRKDIKHVITEDTGKTIVQNKAKKSINEKEKLVEKIENVKSNKSSRSTYRKRKNSESNKKTENKSDSSHSKKAKIVSEHIENETNEDSELYKKKEKRHYTVPSNTTQVSTPDAIRDILKGTFIDPTEEKIKKEEKISNCEVREIIDSQHAVENKLEIAIDHPDTQHNENDPPNKKIVILSDVIVSPVLSRKIAPQDSSQNIIERSVADEKSNQINVISTDEKDMKTNVVLEMPNVTETNSKENDGKNKNKENFDETNKKMDVSPKEESSNSTVISKDMSPSESSTGKKKTKAKKKTPERQELRRSKRNIKTEPPATNKVADRSKEENVDCTEEPSPVRISSFTNILEKNNSPSFQKTLFAQNSVHLTHEGEVPVLNLDENRFGDLPNEIILSKNPDRNIIKLLDNVSISNMECDIQGTEEQVKIMEYDETKAAVESLNEFLTFGKFLGKASSTPIVALSDNNYVKKNAFETLGKTCLFTPEKNENPTKSENVSSSTNFSTATAQQNEGSVTSCYNNEILKNARILGENNGSDGKSEKKSSEASPKPQEALKSGEIGKCNISSGCNDGGQKSLSERNNMSSSANSTNISDTLVRTVSFPRRRRCRIVRIA